MQVLSYDDFLNGGRQDPELTDQDREDLENKRLDMESLLTSAEEEAALVQDFPEAAFECALNGLISSTGIKGERKAELLELAYRQIDAAFDQLMVEARTTAEAVKLAKLRLGKRVRSVRSDINKPRKRGK